MNIKLMPPDPNLAPLFFEWRQDSEAKKYNPMMTSTVEELRERLSKAGSDFTQWDKFDAFFWFVNLDNNIVGNISLQNINKTMLTVEIGYAIAASSRSKGLATAAVKLLTQKVFALTPLRKLIAMVHEDNVASQKLLEKIGYRQEGLLREHFLVNGEPANEIIYGILRRDFSLDH